MIRLVMRAGLLVLAMLVLTIGQVRADTDYHCLNQCARSGKSTSICLPACTYNRPAPSAAASSTSPGNHRLLSTNRRISDHAIETKSKKIEPTVSTDYACMTRCTQNGMAYQLCQENCLEPETKNGLRKRMLPFSDTNLPVQDNTGLN